MVYNHVLESPINTLYFLAFLIGNNYYHDAIGFLDEAFGKNFKQGNMMKIVKKLSTEGYLDENRDGKKINVKVLKKKVLEDIHNLFSQSTERFTYSFKIDGKTVTKKRDFSFDRKCDILKEDFKGNFGDYVIDVFIGYTKRVILRRSGFDSVIDRKDDDFTYFNILKNFIMGFAIDNQFMEEYESYLGGYIEIDPSLKKFKGKEIDNFIQLSRTYLNILSINEMSLVSGRIRGIIRQD